MFVAPLLITQIISWNFPFPWVLGETIVNSQSLVLGGIQSLFRDIAVFPVPMELLFLWVPSPLQFFSSNGLCSFPQWPYMKLRPSSDLQHTYTSHILLSHTNYLWVWEVVLINWWGRNGGRAHNHCNATVVQETVGVIILKSPLLLVSFTGPLLSLVWTDPLGFHPPVSLSLSLFPLYSCQEPDESSWILWTDRWATWHPGCLFESVFGGESVPSMGCMAGSKERGPHSASALSS